MQPLLKIQNIPISIEYKVQRAALQIPSPQAQIRSKALAGSNLQARQNGSHSAGTGYKPRVLQQQNSTRNYGNSTAQEAHQAESGESGVSVDGTSSRGTITNMVNNRMASSAQTVSAFTPTVRSGATALNSSALSMEYPVDRLRVDWNNNQLPQLEYVPGSIEFSVTQYPQVIIEYLGSPIYVPRSADPDYEAPAIDESV